MLSWGLEGQNQSLACKWWLGDTAEERREKREKREERKKRHMMCCLLLTVFLLSAIIITNRSKRASIVLDIYDSSMVLVQLFRLIVHIPFRQRFLLCRPLWAISILCVDLLALHLQPIAFHPNQPAKWCHRESREIRRYHKERIERECVNLYKWRARRN